MKILVMSDTHGWDENAAEAVKREAPFDALIHAGDIQEGEGEFRSCIGLGNDIPAYIVEGNCDRAGFLAEQVIEIAGHRIFLTHGHEYYVSFGRGDLLAAAREQQCDIAVYGHTHKPDLDESDPSVLILNPGSLTFPRQRGKRPSYMVLDLFAGQTPQAFLEYL